MLTNSDIGLTEKEVLENREKYGTNELTNNKTNSFFKLFLESLGDPIIRILLIALGIKTIFLIKDFDWYETVGIVIAIFIASFVSTISEYGSEKAFIKLQEEASKIKCRVLRNRKKVEINVSEVVVGDIVMLETGDKVPADGILVSGNVSVDESSLTGETKEKEKTVQGDKKILRGSVIYSKQGKMLVTKVGVDTVYGKLASELSEKSPDSPLKIRLRELAEFISKIGYLGAFLVVFAYLFSVVVIQNNFEISKISEMLHNFPLMFGHILYALTLCVTVIVVAVPEGLPMMITLVLSSNMKKMLKNNVLVRKLVGIETAGNLNILFTDKTGTLTKGKLEVIGIMTGDFKTYQKESDIKGKIYSTIKDSMVYNNASCYSEDKIIGGNSTDRAILGFIKTPISSVQVLKTVPFDSKNKYMLTTIQKDRKITYLKGAPEKIIPKCTKYLNEMGEKRSFYNKEKITRYIKDKTKQGIRIIAMAIQDDINELVFVGLVLIKDDIRPEAKLGIELVKKAHINTVMITGDNKDTAVSIANEVGLLDQDSIILTSDELNNMSDDEVKSKLLNLKVVARALPFDKSRLVRLAQEEGLIVGMTGDGVNDSPALKKSDVGFAMGSGTEVAKEASDIVIMDDNFLSIAKAVLFGRTIFKSIRKFIIFQLTVNICAISLSIIGPFIGVNTPITVIQMLWINMVMDTLAGLAFSFEPPLLEYMDEKPKTKNDSIMNRYMLSEILFTGFYSSLLCVLFLKVPFFKQFFRTDVADKYFMTAFFGLFIFIGIFNCFNARTTRINLLANILKNKMFLAIVTFILIVQLLLIYYGGSLFRTAGLTFTELQIIIFLSFTVIPVDWIRKIILKKKSYKLEI